jgi:CheY-like chemotaxis protein
MTAESGRDNILVVDDDQAMQTLLVQTLQLEGFDCLTADDGDDAQGILQSSPEALSAVVLDWVMPRMSGIELLRWMKRQPHIEHIPVVMLTALTDPSCIKEGIDAGAFYYLTKPFQRELLHSIVSAAVSDFHCSRKMLRKLKESEKPLALLEEGTFRFRTLAEAELLAVRLASATPDPEHAMPIAELLMNAVEHGNLGITYQEKTQLIENNTWETEVERRLALPENVQKDVLVRMRKRGASLLIEIVDQGPGFDYEPYLTMDESRLFHNHGRGIAIARASLKIDYLGSGNKVVVTIPLH